MTPEDFHRLALALPEAEERSHFGKADFRVRNKFFASLKDEITGVVKLTTEQQEFLTAAESAMFQPVPGGWGTQGWTQDLLIAADAPSPKSVLRTAWRNVAPKTLQW